MTMTIRQGHRRRCDVTEENPTLAKSGRTWGTHVAGDQPWSEPHISQKKANVGHTRERGVPALPLTLITGGDSVEGCREDVQPSASAVPRRRREKAKTSCYSLVASGWPKRFATLPLQRQ